MKMKGRLTAVGTMLVAVLVLLVIAFAVGLSWGSRSEQQRITQDILEQKLQDIGELATVEYHYTNMGKFEDRLDFYGWAVPLTKKSFIVSYDGVIKAGVDVEDLQIEVHHIASPSRGKKFEITLPEPKILSHEIDFGTLTVYDESRNVFNPISITDYQRFSLDQQAAMERRAIEAGLLKEAQAKTLETFRQMLQMMAEPDEVTTVTIRWLPDKDNLRGENHG